MKKIIQFIKNDPGCHKSILSGIAAGVVATIFGFKLALGIMAILVLHVLWING